MKKIAVLCLAAACAGILVQSSLAGIVLDAPGHVYVEGETLAVSNAPADLAWTLTDWLGRELPLPSTNYHLPSTIYQLPTLQPGYYHLRCGNEDVTFAVVPKPEERKFDRDSFYGVDSAQSWVSRKGRFLCPWYGGDTFRLVSDLIWRAGIPHVRDRLSWNEVDKGQGEYDFGHYLYNANLLRERKIGISGMFHDTASRVKKMQKLPADLKALYAFCRKTAETFGDRMEDWEFWNEIDVSAYAPEPVWDYAATMKAAYLGFRDGAKAAGYPELLVLPGSLCIAARSVYDEGLFANDMAKYSDVFNFHTYAPIAQYPGIFSDLRAFMKRVGISDRAVWMTETGTQQEGRCSKDSVIRGAKAHSPEQELIHAEFYAKSQVALQMQGVARNYLFVFGTYNEGAGGKDWGVMRRDGTVKPTYAAMSTIIHELGSARLLGEIRVGEGRRAYLFEQPNGSQTVMFWTVSPVDTDANVPSAKPLLEMPLKLNARDGEYAVTDLYGMRSQVRAGTGALSLTSTRYPAYVSGLNGLKADVPAMPPGKPTPYRAAADEDMRVVFRVDLDKRDFGIAGHKSVAELKQDKGRVRVEIWNLDDKAKEGRVNVSGGTLENLPEKINLPANGCVSYDCLFVPSTNYHLPTAIYETTFVLSGVFSGKRTSRLSMPVRLEKQFIDSCEKQALHANSPERWWKNTTASGYSVVWDEAEKALRFDLSWDKQGVDKWFYPTYTLELPDEDLTKAQFIQFEVKSVQDKPENDFACQYLMLVYEDKSKPDLFMPYQAPLSDWEPRRIELSTELTDMSQKRPKVKAIRLGANPKGMKCTFWVRNIQLLKRQGEFMAQYTPDVAARPQVRGVMLSQFTVCEDDFKTLKEWCATVARYQMYPVGEKWKGKTFDTAGFAAWLDWKLGVLKGEVLPLARKYGIPLVVDLHVPPGGRGGSGMKMLDDPDWAAFFVDCWRKIAERMNGEHGVYAYDLINEPTQFGKPKVCDYLEIQRRAAEAIRQIDPTTPIVVSCNADGAWCAPSAFKTMKPIDLVNIFYQFHMYEPFEYTHQKVLPQFKDVVAAYPDDAKGWNAEGLRRIVEPVREFERRHGARIFVGEFSAVAYAKGCDRWIADVGAMLNEYGWDWCYHAFREWAGWSVEHVVTSGDSASTAKFAASGDNPRRRALLGALRGTSILP